MVPEEFKDSEEAKVAVLRLLNKASHFTLEVDMGRSATAQGFIMQFLGSQMTRRGSQLCYRFSTHLDLPKDRIKEVLALMGNDAGLRLEHVDWHTGNQGRLMSGVARYLWESCEPLETGEATDLSALIEQIAHDHPEAFQRIP